jgi:hypothetical protein
MILSQQLGAKQTKADGLAYEFGVHELCKAVVDDALVALGLNHC